MLPREEILIYSDRNNEIQDNDAMVQIRKQHAILLTLLDCRDLLQKLVESNKTSHERISEFNRRKQIIMEVPFTEKEEELFNGLNKLDV